VQGLAASGGAKGNQGPQLEVACAQGPLHDPASLITVNRLPTT